MTVFVKYNIGDDLYKTYIKIYGNDDDPSVYVKKYLLNEKYELIKQKHTLLKTFRGKVLLMQELNIKLESFLVGLELINRFKNDKHEIKTSTNN
jgi:hypothetical protein